MPKIKLGTNPITHELHMDPLPSSSYSLAEIWPINAREPSAVVLGQNYFQRNVFEEESTVTEQQSGRRRRPRDASASASASEDESSKLDSTSNCTAINGGSKTKRQKLSQGQENGNNVKVEAETSSAATGMGVKKPVEGSTQLLDPPKQDYIHVRARRGQATDSHSLAERARREKISERMKILQDLAPGCNKVIGKALVLDEIINYIQSLQHQVEFISMKLEAVHSSTNIEGYLAKDTLDTAGLAFGSQAAGEYCQGSPPEWMHMQIGCGFERET